MPHRRSGTLEHQLLSLLLRTIAEERLVVADHLLTALENLAPGLSEGSVLAMAYRSCGNPMPTKSRQPDTRDAAIAAPHARRTNVGYRLHCTTARRRPLR